LSCVCACVNLMPHIFFSHQFKKLLSKRLMRVYTAEKGKIRLPKETYNEKAESKCRQSDER